MSSIGALFLFTLAFILGMASLFTYLSENKADVQTTVYSANIFFLGVLLVVVSVISILRFLNKPAADTKVSTSFGVWKIAFGVIGAGLALLISSRQAMIWPKKGTRVTKSVKASRMAAKLP